MRSIDAVSFISSVERAWSKSDKGAEEEVEPRVPEAETLLARYSKV